MFGNSWGGLWGFCFVLVVCIVGRSLCAPRLGLCGGLVFRGLLCSLWVVLFTWFVFVVCGVVYELVAQDWGFGGCFMPCVCFVF